MLFSQQSFIQLIYPTKLIVRLSHATASTMAATDRLFIPSLLCAHLRQLVFAARNKYGWHLSGRDWKRLTHNLLGR